MSPKINTNSTLDDVPKRVECALRNVSEEALRKVKYALERRASSLSFLKPLSEGELERELPLLEKVGEPFAGVILEAASRPLLRVVKRDMEGKLGEGYKPLKYVLLIDEVATLRGLERLIHIGGWAVYFTHVVGQGRLLFNWRGSHDADSLDPGGAVAVFEQEALKEIVLSRQRSTAIADKWAISVGKRGEVFSWDVYYPGRGRKEIKIEDIAIPRQQAVELAWSMGSSRVAHPFHVILLKMRANREKDVRDIGTILSALTALGEEVEKTFVAPMERCIAGVMPLSVAVKGKGEP